MKIHKLTAAALGLILGVLSVSSVFADEEPAPAPIEEPASAPTEEPVPPVQE